LDMFSVDKAIYSIRALKIYNFQFFVLPGSAEALVLSGVKMKYIFIHYVLVTFLPKMRPN